MFRVDPGLGERHLNPRSTHSSKPSEPHHYCWRDKTESNRVHTPRGALIADRSNQQSFDWMIGLCQTSDSVRLGAVTTLCFHFRGSFVVLLARVLLCSHSRFSRSPCCSQFSLFFWCCRRCQEAKQRGRTLGDTQVRTSLLVTVKHHHHVLFGTCHPNQCPCRHQLAVVFGHDAAASRYGTDWRARRSGDGAQGHQEIQFLSSKKSLPGHVLGRLDCSLAALG